MQNRPYIFQLTRPCKASSLLEVVVALSLLALIFVIGSQVWMRTVVAHHPSKTYDMRMQMRALCMEGSYELEPASSRYEYAGYHCIRSVSQEQGKTDLYRVAVTCYRGKEIIGSRHRIVKSYD